MVRNLTVIALCVVATCSLAVGAQRIWIVAQDGSGDFTEVQPAVDAASDGDVIAIKDGTYRGAEIFGKSLALVGSGPGRTILTGVGPFGDAGIFALGNVGELRLAGFETDRILIDDSPCTVIIDDVATGDSGQGRESMHLSGRFGIVFEPMRAYVQRLVHTPSTVATSRSVIAAQGLTVCSLNQLVLPGSPGKPAAQGQVAISLSNPHAGNDLLISSVSALGGQGGGGWLDPDSCVATPAGPGGDALEVRNTNACIAGVATDLLLGGDGGDGEFSRGCDDFPPGGNGGIGLHADGGSLVQYGDVGVFGGRGGDGKPPGQDGSATSGNCQRIGALPRATLSGVAAPGGTITLSFTGEPGDRLVALLAGNAGMQRIGGEGFPLLAVPGKFFIVVPLGTLGPSGTTSVAITLDDDENLIGSALFVQGAMLSLAGAYPPALTNLVHTIVRMP